jgi:hypothetical protein
MDTATNELREKLVEASDEQVEEAAQAAGYQIFRPGDVPDAAWKKMRGWQVWSLLIIMYLALIAVFFFLIVKGADLSADDGTATIGGTMIGGALGLIGAGAAGAVAAGRANS